LVIRSTFIAGFPGETEAEFEHLLDFMREAQIDRAGCFAYSPVEGAAANALPGMLPPNCAKSAARVSWRWPRRCPPPSCKPRWRHHAGAGGFGAGLGRKGGWAQLRRCARDRRRGAPAAPEKISKT
jgi:hypothetical protein